VLKSYLAIFLIGAILLKSEIQIQIKVILEVFNYQSEGEKKALKIIRQTLVIAILM
jgi:hypothetical protein